jgi:hypothetical protein
MTDHLIDSKDVLCSIQSMSGRTLGFGGRILTNDKKAAKHSIRQ